MNPYEKLMARKRKWTPVQTTAGVCKDGAEETIHRALALRNMELPVGDFINDALANDVPPLARELLLSNVRDEENHDLALGYIANAYGVDEKQNGKQLRYKKLGLRILITQLPKRWLPSVQFSSYSSHFLGLMVTLVCEPSRLTSREMNRFMSQRIRWLSRNWDSNSLLPWTNYDERQYHG